MEGLAILANGFALGVGGALALARSIEAQLFGVQPLNAAVLVSATALLAIVALVACSIPANRATRINPVEALNSE